MARRVNRGPGATVLLVLFAFLGLLYLGLIIVTVATFW